MTTPSSFSPSPPASTPAPEPSKKYSPRDRLFHLADKARETAGLLIPTETLELVDIAEHYRNCFLDSFEQLEQAFWDLEHPKSKDV